MSDAKELLDMIVNCLIEAEIERIEQLATMPGLSSGIADNLISLASFFRQLNQARNDADNHVDLYKGLITTLARGDPVTEEFINEQVHISLQRRVEMIALVKKINQIKQQSEVKEQKIKQLSSSFKELQKQTSLIKQLQEKSMISESTQQQLKVQLIQLQDELLSVKSENDKLKEKIIQLQKGKKEGLQKEMLKLKEQNAELKEKVLKFEKQKKSVIIAIERQDLMQSEELSWVSGINQSHMKQKQLIEEKEQIIKKHEETLKSNAETLKKKDKAIKNKDKQIKDHEEKLKQQEEKLREKEKVIGELQENITQLSSKKSMIDAKPISQIFVDKNSMISYLGLDHNCGASFLETMTKELGKIESMVSLYNYNSHKRQHFHKRIYNKKNILLICQTEEGKLIGGFTSAGFSLTSNEPKGTKAFLFTFDKDKMKLFKLKASRASTIFDYDFILFGNEELCIENGQDLLSSYWVSGESKCLHYESGSLQERETFLSNVRGTTSVRLRNYELIELSF